jgi:hypothetical protein
MHHGPALEDTGQERAADAFARRAGPALAGTLAGAQQASVGAFPLSHPAIESLRNNFSLDASGVRLHTDDSSSMQSAALDARAFTVGRDIHFDRGQYRPDRRDGLTLLAHELAHVEQQKHGVPRVQRSPYDVAKGSEDIHDRLGQDYLEATRGATAPDFHPGGVQYTAGYQQWLNAQAAVRGQAAGGPRFLPTTFTQKDPLARAPVAANGLTTYSINGRSTAGLQLAQVLTTLQTQLAPPNVLHSPGLVTGQTQCRFDPAQRIDSGTHVDELTPPPQGGWRGRLAPADVGAAAACPGKTVVPVTLTDVSGDPKVLEKLVHDSEMEHVAELRALHDRHFVPYYRFIVGLTATAGTAPDCETRLRAQIADRDIQAATAFALGDLAATRRYDDPSSTHRGALTPTVGTGCAGVTLTSRQVNPPQAGAGPGNVMPVAPRTTAVDPTRLAVNGSTVMSGANVVRAFGNATDATTAMGVFATLGVTEIRRIGPVEVLFAGAHSATGSLVTGLPKLAIHPDQYQVTIGISNPADWVISEMMGAKFFELANFGASRDEAYSAAALMVGNAISHQFRIGPAAGAGMTFYTA